MRYEGRRIHRHGLHFQTHGIEYESIEHTVLRKTAYHDFRKIIDTFIKGCYDHTASDVQKLRHTFLYFMHLHGIHNPWAHDLHSTFLVILPLREGELRSLLHFLELESVQKLVRDKDGIPFLQRLQENAFHPDGPATGNRHRQGIGSLRTERKPGKKQSQIYQCLTHKNYLFLNKVMSPLT